MSLAGVACRRWPLFEAVTIPDRAFAREVGHFEILRQFQRIYGASIFAESAEHASRSIIGESRQHFPSRGVVTLPAYHDQVLRAGQRAQIAANTQRLVRLRIIVEPRRPAIPLRHHVLRMLRSKRDREAFQKIHLKQALQEFPHAPSLFLPSPIVKQSPQTVRVLLGCLHPDYRQYQPGKRNGNYAEEYSMAVQPKSRINSEGKINETPNTEYTD